MYIVYRIPNYTHESLFPAWTFLDLRRLLSILVVYIHAHNISVNLVLARSHVQCLVVTYNMFKGWNLGQTHRHFVNSRWNHVFRCVVPNILSNQNKIVWWFIQFTFFFLHCSVNHCSEAGLLSSVRATGGVSESLESEPQMYRRA